LEFIESDDAILVFVQFTQHSGHHHLQLFLFEFIAYHQPKCFSDVIDTNSLVTWGRINLKLILQTVMVEYGVKKAYFRFLGSVWGEIGHQGCELFNAQP